MSSTTNSTTRTERQPSAADLRAELAGRRHDVFDGDDVDLGETAPDGAEVDPAELAAIRASMAEAGATGLEGS